MGDGAGRKGALLSPFSVVVVVVAAASAAVAATSLGLCRAPRYSGGDEFGSGEGREQRPRRVGHAERADGGAGTEPNRRVLNLDDVRCWHVLDDQDAREHAAIARRSPLRWLAAHGLSRSGVAPQRATRVMRRRRCPHRPVDARHS